MSDSVFRTAQDVPVTEVKPTQEGITEASIGGEMHIDSLLVSYQDDQGKPYVAQYLDIDNIWDKDPSLKNEIETIEGFLRDRVAKKELDNTTKAGKKYLAELEKKAGTNPYENANKRIQKLLAYIEFKKVVES